MLPVQVSTPWQAAVSIVHSFPYTTDFLACIDALALEEGEPPSEAFKAAQQACQIQEVPGDPTAQITACIKASRSPPVAHMLVHCFLCRHLQNLMHWRLHASLL